MPRGGVLDVVFGEFVTTARNYRWSKQNLEYGGDFYAIAKKSLNKREIRRQKLNERLPAVA